jgi:uncharacterized protein
MRARRTRFTLVATATIAAVIASVAPAATAKLSTAPKDPRPANYIAMADQLSQPIYPNTVREVVRLPMDDGEEIYLEIVKPDPAFHGNGPWPVILEASPYHGTLADRSGTRIFPDPQDEEGNLLGLTGFFAPRGYAVVMMDLRGTGRSQGCLDHIGPNDAFDMVETIEWAASQPWSNGRVGMTGHSYVGSTPAAAAAMDPEGLVTIAPSAGLASMYDHQFNKGVPWLLQWVGPMYAYEQLALYRDLPPGTPPPPVLGGGPAGDNWANAPNPQIGCGLQNSSAISGTGQVTGQYQGWHAARDWRAGAAEADIPIFMIHGVNDNAARIPAAEWFFEDRGLQPGDKIWLGQWDHGSTNGRCGNPEGARVLHPNCRFDQWTYALLAWFDKHLKQMRVNTGPPVEVFLNQNDTINVTQIVDPESLDSRVYASRGWTPRGRTVALFPDATDMSLAFSPPAANGSASFSTLAEAVLANVNRGNVTFNSEPLDSGRVFIGVPEFQLNASVVSLPIPHLVSTLYRVDPDGSREPMNFCAINPLQRNGIENADPVVPGQEMALETQCFTMAHWVPKGDRLQLVVSTGSPHHATFGTYPQVTVYTGPEKSEYTLPVIKAPTLCEDVPLRIGSEGGGGLCGIVEPPPPPAEPAQEGFQESVIVPAPGGGAVIEEPVTAASVEFDVLENFDNASLQVEAIPLLPADIDIYLEKQNGAAWEEITAGESGSLTEETLSAAGLEPGHYRILVHNWAGPPNEVEVTGTFFNSAGEPGPAPGGGAAAASSATATAFNRHTFERAGQYGLIPLP